MFPLPEEQAVDAPAQKTPENLPGQGFAKGPGGKSFIRIAEENYVQQLVQSDQEIPTILARFITEDFHHISDLPVSGRHPP